MNNVVKKGRKFNILGKFVIWLFFIRLRVLLCTGREYANKKGKVNEMKMMI